MKIGSLEVTFHRTVRVANGRQPSNLPPSLGRIKLFSVEKYKEKCPENWEADGFFVPLHDTEALWLSFSRYNPVAVLIGAGGINALTGENLGTTLEAGNYFVTPPQPWLDGWKDTDGTVYQFVATPYKGGKGISVAEQLIREESKTGALGIAVFDPKEPSKIKAKSIPHEGWTSSAYDDDLEGIATAHLGPIGSASGGDNFLKSCYNTMDLAVKKPQASAKAVRSLRASTSFSEMGVGKGGKIIQKIYEDPYGLEVWNEKPTATAAIYLVNAEVFKEITGISVPEPVGHEAYKGKWFGLEDKDEKDVAGSSKFTGLKSSVFPASELDEEEVEKKEGEPNIVW